MRRRQVLALGLVLVAHVADAPAEAAAQGSEGEQLYRAGRFAEAYAAFRQEAEAGEPDPVLAYNAGNALYRLGRYAASGESYREALGGPPELREHSQYNLGNALVKAAEDLPDKRDALRGAVNAYEEALVLEPRDGDAKWNLELALRRLEDEERRQSMSGGGGGGGGGGARPREGEPQESRSDASGAGGGGAAGGVPPAGGDPEPGAAGESPGLTEAEARRLLEAIQGEEGEVFERRDRGRVRASSGRRDW